MMDNSRFYTQPKYRTTDSMNICAILRNDRYRPYLEKRIPAEVALNHFRNVSRLSRITGISKRSIYRAITSGWFSDTHSRKIEYCANGYLKAELTPESAAIKKAVDSHHRSRRATFQHIQKNNESFWNNPLAHGVEDMGNCQLKRIVLGRESPPRRKKYVPKVDRLPLPKVT